MFFSLSGPSTSPAEGNGAADAVYSDVTDLQQGQGSVWEQDYSHVA
uniref:Uncharacterized protein n=1 Tax=Anguilla anguilla TaxID=7936 RepID=A0A0E9R1L1_ANGAN